MFVIPNRALCSLVAKDLVASIVVLCIEGSGSESFESWDRLSEYTPVAFG